MSDKNMPDVFQLLLSDAIIENCDIAKTYDGFFAVHKSISDILASKGVLDFADASGERYFCNNFFDDWFLYAVPNGDAYVYSLFKLREQEFDLNDALSSDGDTPGVTISFISLNTDNLLGCLADPSDDKATELAAEINRVVSYKGQLHHEALKEYFINPRAQGAYLVADMYVRTMASYAENGVIKVPEFYKEIAKRSSSNKKFIKAARLPRFIELLNRAAGRMVCDNENIYIKNREALGEYEFDAILATHTGNTSVYSFAAEVEYHARFLTPSARIRLPFLGRSVYDSAIRADMTVGDKEFEGPAPFYNDDSKIVKRQRELHKAQRF